MAEEALQGDLLVLVDWGVQKLGDHQIRLFVEILEDRCGSGSTLITSQYPVGSWHQVVGNPVPADAICDRLVHNAYHIELTGESMRKVRAGASDYLSGTDYPGSGDRQLFRESGGRTE